MSVRKLYTLVEVDTERCQNTYGVAPCTATGSGDGKCYNTIRTCQVKTAYAAGTYTYRFVERGSPLQAGVNARPYISKINTAPTEIDPEAGLARRASSSVSMVGEKDSDVEMDPYWRDRVTAPSGMFWHRFLARVTNYTDKVVRVKRAMEVDGVLGAFTTEMYLVDSFVGPDKDGGVVLKLKDPITLAGKVKVPTPSDGKLAVAFKISDLSLTLATGGATVYDQTGYVRVGSEIIQYIDKWVVNGWNFANTADGWYAANGSFTTGQYAVTFVASASGPYITKTGLAFSGGGNRYVAVKLKRTVGSTWSGVLQYSTGSHGFSSSYQKTISAPAALITGGDYVIAVWDMFVLDGAGGTDWRDNVITGLQFYIGTVAGDTHTIDWVDYGPVSTDLWDRVLVCGTGLNRAQFGTSAGTGSVGDLVQQCLVYINQPVTQVIQDLILRSGLSITNIDVAGFALEEGWFGAPFNVTTCLSSPELITKYLAELSLLVGAVVWWSPVAQLVKLKAVMPPSPGASLISVLDDTSSILDQSVSVETMDALRKTVVGVYYGLVSATANLQEPANFLNGEIFVDTDAELEYGGRRTDVQFTRWFQPANKIAMQAWAKRRLAQYRDAPYKVTLKTDPKDGALKEGDLVSLTTDQLTDYRGAPKTVKVLVLRRQDNGETIDYIVRSTTFSKPYGFIAPAGTPNYPNNNGYACVSNSAGLMVDGSQGYIVI